MRKTSDVIRLAVANWKYPTRERFLCIVLQEMSDRGEITDQECDSALDAIRVALGGSIGVAILLTSNVRLLGNTDQYVGLLGHTKYPNDLRLQFWAVLVWDLSRKGD